MFLKSAHNYSWAHIWVDAYSNEYTRLKLNRKIFCCVIMDHCFFWEELWKKIISNFYLPPNSLLEGMLVTNCINYSSIRHITAAIYNFNRICSKIRDETHFIARTIVSWQQVNARKIKTLGQRIRQFHRQKLFRTFCSIAGMNFRE